MDAACEAYYTASNISSRRTWRFPELCNNVIPNSNDADDPYNNPDPVSCAKSFVLLLTDGASTKDLYLPDYLKDYTTTAKTALRSSNPVPPMTAS